MNRFDEMLLSETWEAFLNEKKEKDLLRREELAELENFISEKAYLPIVRRMMDGELFSPPKKALISKRANTKKRVVYIYSDEESMTLKCLAWLL